MHFKTTYMASFDIVSEVDMQTVDNAVNAAKKEIEARFDFKGTGSEVALDKKAASLQLTTENDFRIEQMEKVLIGRFVKAKIDPSVLDLSEEAYASGKVVKKTIGLRQGLDRETAKKIVKAIKESKLKAEPQIADDKVKVSSKSIDTLQQVIALCKQLDLDRPLQFKNMKS